MFSTYLDPKMVQNSTILIIGEPGTGKTTLSLQILKELNKKALFVSLDCQVDHIEKLKERMDIKTEINIFDAKDISVIKPLNIRNLIGGLEKVLADENYEGIVFDSIDALEEETPRSLLTRLRDFYRDSGVTVIFTKEKYRTTPTVEEYIFDIIIALERGYSELNPINGIQIVKARFFPHFRDKYPYIFTKDGLEIFLPFVVKQEPVRRFNNYLDEYLPLDKHEAILVEYNETVTTANKIMMNFLLKSPDDKAVMVSEQVTPERLQHLTKIAFSNVPTYQDMTFETLLQSGKFFILDLYNKLHITPSLPYFFTSESKTPEDLKNTLFKFIRAVAQTERRFNLFLNADDIINLARDNLMETFSGITKELSRAVNVTTLITLDASKYDEKVKNYIRGICSYVITSRMAGHAEILELQKTLFGTKIKRFMVQHTDQLNFELFDLK